MVGVEEPQRHWKRLVAGHHGGGRKRNGHGGGSGEQHRVHCKRGKVRTLDDDGHVAHVERAVGRGRDVALEVGDADLPLRGELDEPPPLGLVALVAGRLA